jgi:hypothetical protein
MRSNPPLLQGLFQEEKEVKFKKTIGVAILAACSLVMVSGVQAEVRSK